MHALNRRIRIAVVGTITGALGLASTNAASQTEEYFTRAMNALGQVQDAGLHLSNPPPLGPVTVRVGTYDAASNTFAWNCSFPVAYDLEDQPSVTRPPACPESPTTIRVTRPPPAASAQPFREPVYYTLKEYRASANAILVQLIIDIKNNTQGVVVAAPDPANLLVQKVTPLSAGVTAFTMLAPLFGPVPFSLTSLSRGGTFKVPY